MILSSKQVEFLPAIQWLLSDNNRGEGRTTLMLYVTLLQCLETPNVEFQIVDHYHNNPSILNTIVNRLLGLMLDTEEFKPYNFVINHASKTIKLKV